MRRSSSLCLLATVLALVSGCGGRSDKHDAATDGGHGGSGASSGAGGTTAGASPVTGGSAATAAGTAGTGGAEGGTAGVTAGMGGSAPGTGGASAGSGGSPGGSGGFTGGSGGEAGASIGRSCTDLVDDYSTAYEEAVQCDPGAPTDECTQKLQVGLACGCDAFVNPAHPDAMMRMAEAQSAYEDRACRSGNVCGACLGPVRGRCSDAGRCEGVPPGSGRSCKVAGVVYADGDHNIADPVSCNTCSCDDGNLACTEIGGCEQPCPDGYGFGTGCAQCGPTDACEIPEYDCFRTCQDGCGEPGTLCISGLCIPGVCG